MVGPPQILDFPTLPIFGSLHSLLTAYIEALGPFFSCGRAATQGLIKLLCYVLDMVLVVEFPNLNTCRRGGGLQSVGGDVVLVVGDEGEGEGWTEGRRSREEKARILQIQSHAMLDK